MSDKNQKPKVAKPQAEVAPKTPKKSLAKPTAKVESVKPAAAIKSDKPKKQKMVRDSFTMPQDEYAHLGSIKDRCLKAGVGVKKSEILRAAVTLLSGLSDQKVIQAINKLPAIKTGRPLHHKA